MKSKQAWKVVMVCAGLFVLVWACFGCSIPTRMHLDPANGEITTTEVGYALPLTGVVPITASVDTSGSMGLFAWLGIALGGSGVLTSLLPKGQAIWQMLFTPGVAAKDKLQGLVALPLPMVSSPPPAHAITARKRAVRKGTLV